jgi:hypothetical protein
LLSIAQKANIVIVVNGMRVYVTLLDHIGWTRTMFSNCMDA